jgi:hypothetical protein
MIATETFGDQISSALPSGVSVYFAPANQIVAPAVVLRPDNPWITPRDDGTFCFDHQRYVAIAVAKAATPRDAVQMMYAIARAVIDNLPAGWRFDSVSSPVLDESTGTAFLAASIRLSYFNTEEES